MSDDATSTTAVVAAMHVEVSLPRKVTKQDGSAAQVSPEQVRCCKHGATRSVIGAF